MKEAGMSRKQFSTEKIIGMSREVEVALAQGMKVYEIVRIIHGCIILLNLEYHLSTPS